jgi:hypothetical protein
MHATPPGESGGIRVTSIRHRVIKAVSVVLALRLAGVSLADVPGPPSSFEVHPRQEVLGLPVVLNEASWSAVGNTLFLSEAQWKVWSDTHAAILTRASEELRDRSDRMRELLSISAEIGMMSAGLPYGLPAYADFLDEAEVYSQRLRAIYDEGVVTLMPMLAEHQMRFLDNARSLVSRRLEGSRSVRLGFAHTRMFDVDWHVLEQCHETGDLAEYHTIRLSHLAGYGPRLERLLIEWNRELIAARASSIESGMVAQARTLGQAVMSVESRDALSIRSRQLAERAARVGDQIARLHFRSLVEWIDVRERALGDGRAAELWFAYMQRCAWTISQSRPNLRALRAAVAADFAACSDSGVGTVVLSAVEQAAIRCEQLTQQMLELRLDFDRIVGDVRVTSVEDGPTRSEFQLQHGFLEADRLRAARDAVEVVLAHREASGVAGGIWDLASRSLEDLDLMQERFEELMASGAWPN